MCDLGLWEPSHNLQDFWATEAFHSKWVLFKAAKFVVFVTQHRELIHWVPSTWGCLSYSHHQRHCWADGCTMRCLCVQFQKAVFPGWSAVSDRAPICAPAMPWVPSYRCPAAGKGHVCAWEIKSTGRRFSCFSLEDEMWQRCLDKDSWLERYQVHIVLL